MTETSKSDRTPSKGMIEVHHHLIVFVSRNHPREPLALCRIGEGEHQPRLEAQFRTKVGSRKALNVVGIGLPEGALWRHLEGFEAPARARAGRLQSPPANCHPRW